MNFEGAGDVLVKNSYLKGLVMNWIMYLGVAVNIVGAILLAVYAVGYYKATKGAEGMDIRLDDLRAQMRYRRRLCLGLMMIGFAIMYLGAIM